MYNILDRQENACAAAYSHWMDIVHDLIKAKVDNETGEYIIKYQYHCPLNEALGISYDKNIMEARSGSLVRAMFLLYKKWIKYQMAKRSKNKGKVPPDYDHIWTSGLNEIEKYGRLLSLEERTGDIPLPKVGGVPRYRESWNRHMHDELLRRREYDPWVCVDS